MPRLRALPSRSTSQHLHYVFHEILDLASQIQQLADSYLQELIARCMTLTPSHLLESERRHYRRHNIPWKYPEGLRYQPQDVGPPSWVEEQRAHIALRRLQLLFSLQDHASSLLKWSEEDLINLQNMELDQLWRTLQPGQRQTIKGVYESLKGILSLSLVESSYSSTSGDLNRLPGVLTEETKRPWQSAKPQDTPLTSSSAHYTQKLDQDARGYTYFAAIRHSMGSPLIGARFDAFR